jgi:shikimate dehydrogenase
VAEPSSVTPFVGVLGWPLAHTLSPAIHTAGFRALGLGWAYLSWPVAPESLRAAVQGLVALGAAGANVTIPHKQTVVPMLDGVSGDADAIGAVNTIQRVGDKLVGHNTDVDGFAEFLAGDTGCEVAGRSALVMGAGGAARAVAWALVRLGATSITIAARDESRAREVEELVEGAVDGSRSIRWDEAEGVAPRTDIVVNATPLVGDVLKGVAWRESQVVVDLLYTPPETPLIAAARAGGADAWGGLGMLVRQAAASMTIWTGQVAPLEVMSAAAIHAVGDRR